MADVEKRIAQFQSRARNLAEHLSRPALKELDEYWADLKQGAPPDQISRELDSFEKRAFGAK